MKENKEMGANLAGRVVDLMDSIVISLQEAPEGSTPPKLIRDVQKLEK